MARVVAKPVIHLLNPPCVEGGRLYFRSAGETPAFATDAVPVIYSKLRVFPIHIQQQKGEYVKRNTASSTWTTAFGSLQWLFFIFANTIVVPISIGTAFELPPETIAGIIRSSLIFTGLACALQALWGHRFPLMEGHSGIMWGFVLNLCASAGALGMSLTDIGGGIATGLLLAGGLTVILAAFNLLSFLQKVFNPVVMAVYLFLLTFQLIFIFFDGMIKVAPDGSLDVPVTVFSFAVALFVMVLRIKGSPSVGNFSILIGIVVGWGLYALLFEPSPAAEVQLSDFKLPLFPFGMPNGNVSIIVATFLATVINLSNNIAATQAAAGLFRDEVTPRRLNRSYSLTGFYAIASSVLGLVSYAPFASSIGFLETTRIFDRRPFLIAGGLMIVLGLVPALGGFMSGLPVTVGNSVLFAAYLQLFNTSLRSLNGMAFNAITIHRLALPVLLGVALMTVDGDLLAGLPALVQPLLANGFIVGVLVSLLLEWTVKWERFEEKS